MPKIKLQADTLNQATEIFAPARLAHPIFINSVPKSGTHLLRNIMRMFVPVEQQYHAAFIQWPNLFDNLAAFSPNDPKLSWGHLLFSDASAIETAHCRRIVLVRDPHDWVLARARFMISEQFSGNMDQLKSGKLRIEDLLNLMIFGIHGKAPALAEQYRFNALGWIHTGALMLRYEDLVLHANAPGEPAAEAYFSDILAHAGIALPADWRDRVETGADRKQSSTAREKLEMGEIVIPDELPEGQKRLIEVAAPGLRALLGYA
jgi:hypothetical protein